VFNVQFIFICRRSIHSMTERTQQRSMIKMQKTTVSISVYWTE